jgi:hypothetical protein
MTANGTAIESRPVRAVARTVGIPAAAVLLGVACLPVAASMPCTRPPGPIE